MQLSDREVKNLEFNDAEILSIQNNDEGDVELEIEMESGNKSAPARGRLVFVAAYVLEPQSNELIETRFREAFFRSGESRGKIRRIAFQFDEDEKQAQITFSKRDHGKGGEELHSLNVKCLAVKWLS